MKPTRGLTFWPGVLQVVCAFWIRLFTEILADSLIFNSCLAALNSRFPHLGVRDFEDTIFSLIKGEARRKPLTSENPPLAANPYLDTCPWSQTLGEDRDACERHVLQDLDQLRAGQGGSFSPKVTYLFKSN